MTLTLPWKRPLVIAAYRTRMKSVWPLGPVSTKLAFCILHFASSARASAPGYFRQDNSCEGLLRKFGPKSIRADSVKATFCILRPICTAPTFVAKTNRKQAPWNLVSKRTIPTERPLPAGKVSANFYRYRGVAGSAQRVPAAVNIGFLDRSRHFSFQVAP
jgi:hypothetical protein